MADTVIQVQGLAKRYRKGQAAPYARFSEMLAGLGGAAVRAARKKRKDGRGGDAGGAGTGEGDYFWALRDVSFEVGRGEVLGVIGRNGAGKSTLLKILSRITDPTAGRAVIHGRVGSLLEVGTGFHPELTGGENIYLNGAILGMSRKEVRARFNQIVDFAEVPGFLDTPVKHYSSGMYTRLAFAVAAHLETEILIVDEVLAVGDAAFQKKCLGKMSQAASGGRTILFVSHNMPAVERLCSRGMVLDGGKVLQVGPAGACVRAYVGAMGNEASAREWRRPGPGTGLPHFTRVYVCDAEGKACAAPTSAGQFGLAMEVCIPSPGVDVTLAVAIHNKDMVPLFASSPGDRGVEHPRSAGVYRSVVIFPRGLFMPMEYFATFSLYSARECYDSWEGALRFDVTEVASLANLLPTRRMGSLQVLAEWGEFERLTPQADSAGLS